MTIIKKLKRNDVDDIRPNANLITNTKQEVLPYQPFLSFKIYATIVDTFKESKTSIKVQ